MPLQQSRRKILTPPKFSIHIQILKSGMNNEMNMTVHNQNSVSELLTFVSLGDNYFMQLLMFRLSNVSATDFKVHTFYIAYSCSITRLQQVNYRISQHLIPEQVVFLTTIFPSFTNYLCKCPIGLRRSPSKQLQKTINKCQQDPSRCACFNALLDKHHYTIVI
jgi:hypothetical protein